MRDIRGDLQDRANRVSEQISATQSQFDKVIKQLKVEHQVELENLKSDLDAVRKVVKTEDRLGSRVSLIEKAEPKATQQLQQAQSQHSTSDSLMRKASVLR